MIRSYKTEECLGDECQKKVTRYVYIIIQLMIDERTKNLVYDAISHIYISGGGDFFLFESKHMSIY
jgi:hypothetical protein